MSVMHELRRHGRQIVFSLLAIGVIGYFAYHAVEGDRGLRAYFALKHETAAAQQELAVLRATRKTLERRVMLLRPDSLDLDLLEERARAVLNLGHPDELVILLPRQGG